MRAALIFASHLFSLALAVYTTRSSGVPVEILLYAFLIDYLLRLGTIHVLHAELAAARPGWVEALAPYISRLPTPGQQSHPVRDGEGGPPADVIKYFVVMIALWFFAFVLMHVNADREIDFTAQAGVNDLVWALVIGAIYWVNSLLTRTMVIHPREPVTRNFGYNSKEVTILALAVLTGAVVVMVRQNMALEPSGWTVMGPLLFFRFLYDLWASLDAMGEAETRTTPTVRRKSR
jgi:hypothetical protein